MSDQPRPLSGARRRSSATAAALLVAFVTVAGCGSGEADAPASAPTPAAPAPSTGIDGSVAVGAPITNGTLRVLDAAGIEVARDVPIADDGTYTIPTLTGTGPWRLEACGFVGGNYQCIYSVAQATGVVNVTPLTTAAILLATGESPEALMAGPAAGLGADAIDAAQQQLRDSLAGVMSGHVAADFDLFGGPLDAGTRTGYDRVLDAVGVSTGVDGQPYVQITPRMGEGNVYMQRNSTQGALQVDSAAASLPLDGIERLFADMTLSIESESACSSPTTGLVNHMAADARMRMEGMSFANGEQLAAGLCQFFAMQNRWGSKFVSPALGRCDLSGAQPRCRVSFAMKDPQGAVEAVGDGMAVTRVGDRWKFFGDMDPIAIRVNATVQVDRRMDTTPVLERYTRALSFSIPALGGLACAKVTQINTAGDVETMAYFKRHPGAVDQQRLSLWTQGEFSLEPSNDPAVGRTRSADDSWLQLPQGASGDALIRNFLRGGRSVSVALYSDDACSVPMSLEGRAAFDIDVAGVPPVFDALGSLPWPGVSDRTLGALTSLTMEPAASATLAFEVVWPRGSIGLTDVSLCKDLMACGEGGSGRIGEQPLRPGTHSAVLTITNGAEAMTLTQGRMLSLYGRSHDGMAMQTNLHVCPLVPSGNHCL